VSGDVSQKQIQGKRNCHNLRAVAAFLRAKPRSGSGTGAGRPSSIATGSAASFAQANTLAELRGWTQFAGLQIEYSLVERTVERELIPMAKALNLGVLAWSPLAGACCPGSIMVKGKLTAAG
jgi:hypothetical protein